MTLLSVKASPTLRLVSKAVEVDPDGTHELLRFALYETLCDQVEAARPFLERDLDAYLQQQDDVTRRAVVRKFIDARIAGENVEEIAKAATQDNPKTRWWDARDVLGRFASKTSDYANPAREALEAAGREGLRADPFDKPRYASMRATGAALGSLNDPNAKLIGAAAGALGQLGPEAERVLGNGLRRTAYRYRGTEKKPSRELKAEIEQGKIIVDPAQAEQAARLQSQANDDEIRGRALAGKPFDKDRSTTRARTYLPPAAAIGSYYHRRGKNLSQDQLEMRVAGDIAANYYLDKLPTPEQTAISIAAGAVPPSQGVIIDADGDVVSEAMGHNGDHYVPFDLKNLRSLQGGQYVRTRAVGGPTTEDIYTGLLSGARQVQVVSSSGVFTLEFDPSVRGGRRYSDKARQMVTRYQRILDAIDQSEKSGLYQVDITPKERRDIQQKYAKDYSGEELEFLVDRDVKQLRTEKSFKMLTDDEIMAEARRRHRASDNRGELKNLVADVKEENRLASVKRFQLDGDGYEAALQALKQEFPYFIRTAKRERLPDFVQQRGLHADVRYSGATDQGYVSPSTAVTGRARSVSNKQKPYDIAERAAKPKGAAEDQEDASGAPGAAGAAPRAIEKPRLEAKELNRKAASAFANVASMQPSLGFDPAVTPQLEQDEWDGQPAMRIIHEAAFAGSRHKGGYAGYLNEMSTEGKTALLDALEDVPDIVGSLEMSQKERDAISSSAAVLRTVLDATVPFEDGDPLEFDPSIKGRPVNFPGLPSPMEGVAEVDETIKHLQSGDKAAFDYIEAFNHDDGDSDAIETIDALMTAYNRHNDAQTAGNLRSAQLAFAFTRIRRQAVKLEQLLGGPPGKAAASREEAQTDLGKRLTWHPPGSPVADEFRKFLSRR